MSAIQKIVFIAMLLVLVGCRCLFVELQIETTKDTNQNGRVAIFFVKDEIKYKDLLDKTPTELNAYTLQHLLTDRIPPDIEITGDIKGRMAFNTKEADLCVVVYTFTYRETEDIKKITGSIKKIDLQFYAGEYPWRILCYWGEDENHHKKEELPESITGKRVYLTITCNREKGATFQWK